MRKIFGFPGKYKSPVWESFGFYMDDNGKLDRSKAICRLCRRAIAYSGNTTNLHNHVFHHHRQASVYSSNLRISPDTRYSPYTAASSDNGKPGDSDLSNTSDGDKSSATLSCPLLLQTAILEFLINDIEPVQTVDSPTFHNLMKSCGSKQDIPSSDYFTNLLLEAYVEIRQKVMNIVATAKSVYLKLNIWQTNGCRTNILTVSAQILHANLKVESYILNTVELPDSYAHTDISSCLVNIYSEWNIPETSVLLSADVIEIAEAAKIQNYLKLNCLIDSINSAVNTCLNKPIIEGLLSHARKLILWFTENPSASTMLHEKQALLSLPQTRLKLDSKLHWQSTYEMLDMLQEQTAAIYAIIKDPLFHPDIDVRLFDASEQTLIQTLLAILKSLMMAVSMVREMSFLSAAVILPVLKKLETTLKITEVDSQVIVDVKKSLWTKLCEKYATDDIRCFLLICSLLDPRYKDLKFVEAGDREKALELLKAEMKNIATAQSSSASKDIRPVKDDSPEVMIKIEPLDEDLDLAFKSHEQSCIDSASPFKKQKKEPKQKQLPEYVDWLDDVVHDEVPKDTVNLDAVAFEVSRYENEKQIISYSSPLSWWGERQFIYPLMYQVAKKYLSAPAILKAADERQIDILERKQQSIAPEFVEYMVFLNGNYFKVKQD